MDIHSLSNWLTDKNNSLPIVDHQDGAWVIASSFTHDDLLPLLAAPQAVSSRRDSIIYALIVQLEGLLEPAEPNEPYDEASSADALVVLTQYARDNWTEILRIEREMGFGSEFDTFVVPHITSL